MKKTLLPSIIAILISTIAHAQKNTLFLSGEVSYVSTKPSYGAEMNYFSIMPSVGYQFNDNWTVGGNIGFSSSRFENMTPVTKSHSIGIGPFIRYSKNLGGIFGFYGRSIRFLRLERPSRWAAPILLKKPGLISISPRV